jgi:ubiquinone/menaquinone biosynthesis C-methylase UbiE
MSLDRFFAGSIPSLYERLLVPLIFAPYALDLARRARSLAPTRVLEIAAGTGVVTRALAEALPASCEIIATDLNPAMLEEAQHRPIAREVTWRSADALELPFDDASFDLVVCQFGVMFFPDRVRGYAQARRVLEPEGSFLFNSWDAIAQNDFAEEVTKALAAWQPAAALGFLARTPHGYHEPARIRADLAAAGFADVRVDVVAARSVAESARAVAIAYCQGTPLRNEIEALGPGALEEATEVATDALARRFGGGPVDGNISALVALARRGEA